MALCRVQGDFAADVQPAHPFLQLSTPSVNADGSTGTNPHTGSAGGNPYLKPMTAKQYDTSLEWYMTPSSLLYGALFFNSVDGFVQTVTQTRQYPDPTPGGDRKSTPLNSS